MLSALCELLEAKIERLSNSEKAQAFIGSIHLQKPPFISLMYENMKDISYDEFASSAMTFLKNYDEMLQNETKYIEIREEGG